MQAFVTPLFGHAKLKLTQTPRAVTPFGGLASFIAFLHQRGLPTQLQQHLPWALTSPNAIPLAHTFTAFLIGVITGARCFAHTEMARADREGHDGQVARGRIASNGLGGAQAVNTRQAEIHQNLIRRSLAHQQQACFRW